MSTFHLSPGSIATAVYSAAGWVAGDSLMTGVTKDNKPNPEFRINRTNRNKPKKKKTNKQKPTRRAGFGGARL